MSGLIFFAVFFVFGYWSADSATVSWNSDQITLTSQQTQHLSRHEIEIEVSSNGMIYDDETGNFKLSLEAINKQGSHYVGETDCMYVSATVPTLQKALNNLRLYFVDSKGDTDLDSWHRTQDLFFVDVKRYFYRDNYTAQHLPFQTNLQMGFTKRTNATRSIDVTISQHGCSPLRTISNWSNHHRWSGLTVPTEDDDVMFMPGAGVAVIDANITIHSLNMSGGHIVNYKTYCPRGWSVEPEGYHGIKCYKLFEIPSTFDVAEKTCNAKVGMGSDNRHLIHIRNRAELLTSMRLCRGATGSAVHSQGCWIGLRDRYSSGEFNWISPLAVGGTDTDHGMFLDWRRDEPNNHSLSEGFPAQGGERCAALVPWQEDPLVLEQGSWNDDSCSVSKPFVCQTFGNTERYSLTVLRNLLLTAGTMEGGVLISGSGTTELFHFTTVRGGRIEISGMRDSAAPSRVPTQSPTRTPTRTPSTTPTLSPSAAPIATPTRNPTAVPTVLNVAPTFKPTAAPTRPTARPTILPTFKPSALPTLSPTLSPTCTPTCKPTTPPTRTPTRVPTAPPTNAPTVAPSAKPTAKPTTLPTISPSRTPTNMPTRTPTCSPSAAPSVSSKPTAGPTTFKPTVMPTLIPTSRPTIMPSWVPTAAPTSHKPTAAPTRPTARPTTQPTYKPSAAPTVQPTAPTARPTATPSVKPTATPTAAPTSLYYASVVLPMTCVLGKVLLQDGASLVLNNNAITVSNAFIGEPWNASAMVNHVNGSYLAMQPFVRVASGSRVMLGSYCPANHAPNGCATTNSNVTINARAFVEGKLDLEIYTEVVMLQGAEMSASAVAVSDVTSQLVFSGYNSRLSSYDAYELVIANRGEVVGEFYRDISHEEANEHLGAQTGVYRLRLTASSLLHAPSNVTACIPYNATAAQLTTLLNDLRIVHKRGGVTVRRYGSPTDPKYRFGYTYRIEMDSVTTNVFSEGPLTMKVECYGFDNSCGCAETKVQMVDVAGVPQCPAVDTNRSSLVQTDACVYPPTISVSTISALAYTATSGSGAIEIREGVHRFPPVTYQCTLAVKAGTGVVAADTIRWTAISITDMGRLVAAGTGWDAWDSTYALYGPEWTTKRGQVRARSAAAPFDMTVQRFYLDGLGSMLASCPRSNITWTSGTWAGGIIGGRAILHITDTINAQGTGKSLRYGITMMIDAGAKMAWTAGNLSLADGADLIVEGSLDVDTSASGVGVFVGMAQLLRAPIADTVAQAILYQEPTRNWHSYYGDELPSELRGGWYQNPLCGDQCLKTNHLIVRSNGAVNTASSTKVTFSLPLDLIGESRMNIGSDVDLNLASGGICGNEVIIDIGSGTTLSLSGGQMSMEAFCTIQGDGELLVVGGSHDLSFSIDAHITIEGGTMVWPLSRGDGQTISFNGGLLVQKTGELIVNPFSTTIKVFKEVYLKDQSLLQFPLIGIAAQASLFDAQNAPDSSPRGILISNGTMRWEGGTLRGKADFNAELELFLDGDAKYIQSLAKLVNKGHCEWGTGDLISSDSGDFLNLGTVQMKRGVSDFFSNAMYQGTELPIENGGDVFALEYHSWDMDNGGLDYREYVKQRTEFVSRAPNGWTKESQNE